MARTARQILNSLSHDRSVHARSTAELGSHVESAAAAIDKKRREKGQEAVRRKPELRTVAWAECGRSIELTPWQVLHALARGYVLAGQGMGHGLAEHWLSLKYSRGHEHGAASRMGPGRLTTEMGSRPRPDYLIEAWKPGAPSKVTFVACRGNHQKPSKRTSRTRSTTIQQLVTA
jgi:hypothetical protein